MTDNTLEAVARAIDPEAWEKIDTIMFPKEYGAMMGRREMSSSKARRAIQALIDRDVSDKMTGAGLRVLVDHLDYVQNEDPALCFQAMLTASLGEK